MTKAVSLKPIKHCVICGGDLGKGQRKACSAECRHAVDLQRIKNWRDKQLSNPDEPPVDEFGEPVYIDTPRRVRLRNLFEFYNPWHFDKPIW